MAEQSGENEINQETAPEVLQDDQAVLLGETSGTSDIAPDALVPEEQIAPVDEVIVADEAAAAQDEQPRDSGAPDVTAETNVANEEQPAEVSEESAAQPALEEQPEVVTDENVDIPTVDVEVPTDSLGTVEQPTDSVPAGEEAPGADSSEPLVTNEGESAPTHLEDVEVPVSPNGSMSPVGVPLSPRHSPPMQVNEPQSIDLYNEPDAIGERRRQRAQRRMGSYAFGGISEDDEMGYDDYEDEDEATERIAKKTKEQEEAEAAVAAAERLRQQRESLIDEYQRVQQQREQIQTYNYQLQHKLADYFRKKRSEEASRGIEFEKPSAEQEQRYAKYMTSIEELRVEIIKQQNRYTTEIDMLKEEAERQRQIIDEEFTTFQQQQKDVGLKSVSQQTGRLMEDSHLDQELSSLAKKELEVTTMRLQNIKVKNRLQKQEDELRSRDEIGEGLHMIDFEQLKIENQTYNEKIEERNEELTKLRKKITNTVQIMTHLKEKIQFLQNENERLKANLAAVDAQVASSRDNLARTKHIRDSLRFENQRLRTNCGLLGHDELLRDFEIVVDHVGEQREKLEKMKMEHTELTMLTTGLRRKIEQVNAGGAGGSKGLLLPSIPLGQNSTVASQPSFFQQ